MKRIHKEVYIADFPPEELPLFQPGKPIDCFVWEFMSEPEDKPVGQYLISELLKFFHTLGKRGVEIEGVCHSNIDRRHQPFPQNGHIPYE